MFCCVCFLDFCGNESLNNTIRKNSNQDKIFSNSLEDIRTIQKFFEEKRRMSKKIENTKEIFYDIFRRICSIFTTFDPEFITPKCEFSVWEGKKLVKKTLIFPFLG